MQKVKLILSLFFFVFFIGISHATIINVDVSDFAFTPISFDAAVGDTVVWTLSSGTHTTTSTSVPSGAATWDYTFTGIGDTFSYIITVPGVYEYHCTIHPTLMIASFSTPVSLPLIEEFDYPVDDLLKYHGWVNHSGTGTFIPVIAGSLTYPGYPSSGIGNSTEIVGGSGSREDIHRNFDVVDTQQVYAAFLVSVVSAATTGDYFAHFGPTFPTTLYRARLFVKDDGAGNLLFGLSKASTSTVEYTTTTYSYNTTYLLVLKYEFVGDATGSDDVVKLYIDPNPANPEPAVPDLENSDSNTDETIGSFALRQGSQAYDVQFDGLRISKIWEEVLPVELTSLSANVSNNNVNLNWTTKTEINNSGFEVQRKTANSNWEDISFVRGYGTSSETHKYTYTDENLNTGKYFYRLKQVDLNGSYKYSDVVSATVNQPFKFDLAQNYPNPFNPSTTIKFSIPKASNVTLRVYNLLGQEVQTLINGFKQAGNYEIKFNARELTTGMYLYKLEAGAFSSVRKMILMK
jgi:Secretion system C-terminal sorting domain